MISKFYRRPQEFRIRFSARVKRGYRVLSKSGKRLAVAKIGEPSAFDEEFDSIAFNPADKWIYAP